VEHRLTTFEDIINTARIVETKRAISETKMNATSSRSHAAMLIKLYKKEGEKCRVNFFQFIDLAGSERMGKTGNAPKNNMAGMEACMTNLSLLTISRCVLGLKQLKKPLANGQDIPASIPFKEFMLTKVFMRPCFNGDCYTIFNFCISQHEQNSGETWCAMEFSDKCKDLVSGIRQQPMKETKAVIKELEDKIKKCEADLTRA